MKVYIYRNLGSKYRKSGEVMYSVRDTKTGRVVDHRSFVLLEDVTFRVGKAGQAEVRRTGTKAVHAGVQGTRVPLMTQEGYFELLLEQWIPVYYNPHKVDTFVRLDTFEPIYKAKRAYVSESGVYAQI